MKYFIAIILSLFHMNAYSENGAYFNMGLHSGGDTLLTAFKSDGSSESISAGGGVSFNVGYQLDADRDGNMAYQIGLGFQDDTISASNGSASITTIPLHANMLFNISENFNAGVGILYHLSPSMRTDGFLAGYNFDFDNALGYAALFNYKIKNPQLDYVMYVGVQITSMQYVLTGASSSRDASGAALVVGMQY